MRSQSLEASGLSDRTPGNRSNTMQVIETARDNKIQGYLNPFGEDIRPLDDAPLATDQSDLPK